jgi:hypothetical protein
MTGRNDPERPRYMLRQTMKRNVAPTDVKRLFANFGIHLEAAYCLRYHSEASLDEGSMGRCLATSAVSSIRYIT